MLHEAKRELRRGECRVSGSERMKLFVRKVFLKLGVERVKLVVFRMVSTVIKYDALCHARATRRFRCEPHDMVICK